MKAISETGDDSTPSALPAGEDSSSNERKTAPASWVWPKDKRFVGQLEKDLLPACPVSSAPSSRGRLNIVHDEARNIAVCSLLLKLRIVRGVIRHRPCIRVISRDPFAALVSPDIVRESDTAIVSAFGVSIESIRFCGASSPRPARTRTRRCHREDEQVIRDRQAPRGSGAPSLPSSRSGIAIVFLTRNRVNHFVGDASEDGKFLDHLPRLYAAKIQ